MRWYLFFTGLMMLIYLIGSFIVGQLGFAVALGHLTAFALHVSVGVAITVWTLVYILLIVIVFLLAFFWEERK